VLGEIGGLSHERAILGNLLIEEGFFGTKAYLRKFFPLAGAASAFR
jgi:hypothetical protein